MYINNNSYIPMPIDQTSIGLVNPISERNQVFPSQKPAISGWMRVPSEMKSNSTIAAINSFNPLIGKYLEVKNAQGQRHLEVTPGSNVVSMLCRKINRSMISNTADHSIIGMLVREIDKAYTNENTSMRKVAKYLKEHENELSKPYCGMLKDQKELLKQKLIQYEINHNIQFTFIDRLFGKRTGNHIHFQTKMHDLVDASSITSKDMSCSTLSASEMKPKSDAEIQHSIGKILQDCILPIYKTPMPSNGTYQQSECDSERKMLFRYSIQRNESTARSWHDSMHAVRVTFWTQVLIEIYKEYGKDTISNRILLGVGGGFHDAAREDEGQDRWDRESSQLLDHFLNNMEVNPEEIEIHVHALRDKDPEGGLFISDIQRIIHDADCLDIIRAALDSFDPSYLCFSKFESSTFDILKFVNEAKDFIAYTEALQIKCLFERESQDFYGDLIRLLFKLEDQEPGRFKKIIQLISKSLDCYKKSMNNDFVLKIAEAKK